MKHNHHSGISLRSTLKDKRLQYFFKIIIGPGIAVCNVSDCRYMSDCRSSRREFNPSPADTFMEIDHEIISTTILLPSADSRRVVFSYKRKYVHEVLVNSLVKLVQEKSVVR